MKRILLVCSMFLLLFTSLAHADISHHNTSLFNTKSKHLSVEKKSTSIKYAGVVFITDYREKNAFGRLSFPKESVVCSSSQYPLGESPEHCCSVDTCTDSNEVTHYGCKTCCPGYSKKNNVCSADDCTGYGSTGCEIEHCATLESGDCHKNVDSCQKGDEKVYKCLECEQGYEVNDNGGCSATVCSSTLYPYPNRPTICSGEPLVCRGGDNLYYGCEACELGYTKSGGHCMETVCASEYGDSCPEHGVCDMCQSGETTKYKLTGCKPTYELNNEGTACVRKKALAFTVTIPEKIQNEEEDEEEEVDQGTTISLSLTGDYEIDWGDGNIETGTGTTTLADNGYTSKPDAHSHSYAIAGSYDVYVTGTPTYAAITSGQSYVTALIDISLPSIVSYYRTFSGASKITSDLTNMEFPNGLKNAGSMFLNCFRLTGSIPELPDSLIIGYDMFMSCRGLTGSIPQLPSGLTDASFMFSNCSGLTGSIPELPSSIKNGASMFSSCSGLTGNIPPLPSSLTTGESMFGGCSGLTGGIPTLPSGLTNGRDMFYHCSGLTGNIPELPSGLKDGYAMFEGCTGLTGFDFTEFPTDLTKVDDMFRDCTGLTGNIPELPSKLTDGYRMFSNCSGLTGFGFDKFPSNLSKGQAMFANCTGLTGTIPQLPSRLTYGVGMFSGCTGLTGSIPELPSYLNDGTSMFSGCTGLTDNIPELPSKLTDGYAMFKGCTGLTGNIPALPESLTNGTSMFQGCTGLSGNIPGLPEGLTNGTSMFQGCTGLSGNIQELPARLKTGTSMFKGCTGLTGFGFTAFPNTMTVSTSMFQGCTGLTGNIPELSSKLVTATSMFQGCTGLTGFGFRTYPSTLKTTKSMYKGASGLVGCRPKLQSTITEANSTDMYTGTQTIDCADCEEGYVQNTLTGECTPIACDRNIYPYSTSEWSCYVNETDGEGHCDYCTDSTGTYMAVTCSLEDYSPYPDSGRVGCVLGGNCPTEGVGWIHRDTFGTDPNIMAHCANLRWCQFDSSYAKCYGCDDGYTLTHNPAHVCEEQ